MKCLDGIIKEREEVISEDSVSQNYVIGRVSAQDKGLFWFVTGNLNELNETEIYE